MIRPTLNQRMLAATVLPAMLVALALAAILLNRHYDSLDEAMQARARANARQLASAAEFGVFAGSNEALQVLTQATLAGDADIVAVAILGNRGERLAGAGTSSLRQLPATSWDEQVSQAGDFTVVQVPISRSRIPVDDVYSGGIPAANGPVAGFVVLEMSRRHLYEERNRQIAIGLAIAVAGSLLAAGLALTIARGILRPLLHIGDVVGRIGGGDNAARVVPDPGGAMAGLEEGINRMAEQVAMSREELQRRIDAATAELLERKNAAERANAAKSRFVAAASHDLRQPLHALGLFVSRLGQFRHSREVTALVGNIGESVDSLQDLLETLLDMSRLDAGMVNAKPKDFAIDDLFASLQLEHEGLAEEKGLRLLVRPSALWLRTDPGLLMRILMNFVSNALRYTARGGVLVGCRRRSGIARIEVWDSGHGIPEAKIKEVFSEYVQLDNPERSRAKGLGLGLAICDRLAGILGLRIGVHSRPGRGSVFWVEVPIGTPSDEVAVDVLAVPEIGVEGTVVVLESDEATSAGLIGLLAGWGCLAIGAHNAGEALTLCDESDIAPDLVITDWQLEGGEDGIAAGLAIRRRYGPIPVLLFTAEADERLVAGAARRQFTLMTKPVRAGKLRAVVQQLLAKNTETADE